MAKRRSVAARILASYVAVLLAFGLTAAWSIASERSAAQEAELLRTGYVPLKFSVEKALDAQNLVSAELSHITEAKNPSDARNWIETERRVRPTTFAKIRAVAHDFSPVDDCASAIPSARTSFREPTRSSISCKRTESVSPACSRRSEWATRKRPSVPRTSSYRTR